jgi:hypothetical protein
MNLTGVPAPVDLVFRRAGVRLRHIPGRVDLASRAAAAPPVEPIESLAEDIQAALSGTRPRLTILKAEPVANQDQGAVPARPCPGCAGQMAPALLDCALGDAAGLVVERVAGYWCWPCRTATIPEEGTELRRRLLIWQSERTGTPVPSFVYDTPPHPRSLQFEVTTRCNLRCGYCSHRHLPEKRDQSLDDFQRMLGRINFTGVENVDFTGLGEAPLHRALPAMIAEIRARAARAEIRIVSNGTALRPDRFIPLIEAGATSIAVSIDSLDHARFARRRRGARLDSVLANIDAMLRFRDERGLDRPRIKVKAVLTDDVYQEADSLLVYSARAGLDMPHFSTLDRRAVAASGYDAEWRAAALDEARPTAAFDLWTIGRWFELTGRRPGPEATPSDEALVAAMPGAGFRHPQLEQQRSVCRWAVDACFIALDGSLLSCCETMIDRPRHAFADLAQAPLAELWTGELLWGYRLPLALGMLPMGCVGCAQAPSDGRPIAAAG